MMRISPSPRIDSVTFCKVFEDYQVPIRLTQEQLESENKRLGFQPSLSVGLYDEERLVGFVLNACRDNLAYDCGTGIFKEYRHQGYGTKMVEKAAALLAQAGIRCWKLEVLQDNTSAISLYRHFGFSPSRSLNCYRIMTSMVQGNASVELAASSASVLLRSTPVAPSWQNSNDTIAAGLVPVYGIVAQGISVGYIAFTPSTGTVMQLFIDEKERRKGYGAGALQAASHLTKNAMMKCNNVDASSLAMNGLFEKAGFSCYCKQYEMQRLLDSAIVSL